MGRNFLITTDTESAHSVPSCKIANEVSMDISEGTDITSPP
jgi:hypothetical protein